MNERIIEELDAILVSLSGMRLAEVVQGIIMKATFVSVEQNMPFTRQEVASIVDVITHYIASNENETVIFHQARPALGPSIDAEEIARLHSLDLLFETEGDVQGRPQGDMVASLLACVILRYRFCATNDKFMPFEYFLRVVQYIRAITRHEEAIGLAERVERLFKLIDGEPSQ